MIRVPRELSNAREITAALIQSAAKRYKPSGLIGRRGSGGDGQLFTDRRLTSKLHNLPETETVELRPDWF